MVLRRLVLHGFKTFAVRTSFEFGDGITAIIGPNGSGKSNLADAVRWVLGETSQAALRSRRTEEIIFAGSSRRPAMSMAEVSLTIDNDQGLLDSEFAEVTITRRAFRDGENQYLINGHRVRLRDVAHLTAPLGGAYTVIGQGLVDAALSLRPDERRGLFEHAAGITGQQLKRTEAERRLSAAEANCQRLADILSELTPRLRTLERQARLAGEAAELQGQLTLALQRWYGAQWRDQQAVTAAAEAMTAEQQQHLASRRATLATLEAERQQRRQLVVAQREAQQALLQERAGLNREISEAVRLAAVAAERAAARQRQLTAGESEQRRLNERRHQLANEIGQVDTNLIDLDEQVAGATSRLAEAEQATAAGEGRSQALAAMVRQRRQALLAAVSGLGRLETEAARLHERRLAAERELERQADLGAERLERQASLMAEQQRLGDALNQLATERRSLEEQQTALLATLAHSEQQQQQQQQALLGLDHRRTGLQARLEALTRLRESGAGIAAGPRAVRAAVQAGRLTGILGSVAELIGAPEPLETAIEVALGGHLHDIVVASWHDAERAIALLKQTGAGRATFQPLDTLRPARALPATRATGVVGAASRLVEFEAPYRPLVEALLGRVLIVDDLTVSRQLVAAGTGWTLVTLSGEITRPGGAVTGGAPVREAGLLARERELRQLPRQLGQLTEQRQVVVDSLSESRQQQATIEQQRQQLTTQLNEATRRADRLSHQLALHERELATLAAAIATAGQQRHLLNEQHRTLLDEVEQVSSRRAGLHDEQGQQQAALDTLSEELAAAAGQRAALLETVGEARTLLARLEERRRAEQARRTTLTAEHERLTAQTNELAIQHERVSQELAAAEAEHTVQSQHHHRLARALTRLEERAAPGEAGLQAAIQQADASERRVDAAGAAWRAADAAAARAQVAVEAALQARQRLAERIAAELTESQPANLVSLADDDPRLAGQVVSLRERVRRLGLVDPSVLDDYAATRERHEFLSRELSDVEAAIAGLRAAISELDQQMQQRFGETFRAVNEAFAATFARLFTGGTARLILIEEEQAGVDIVAQPPGKRLQNLALLSGGERAMTAVALLFAILTVNPSPFVLLDEVDAALDESNVTRFRELLTDLANRTQFVVVTHNRGTIEGADTLYGISMSQDGLSQVISLRLEQTEVDLKPAVARSVDRSDAG